MTLSWLSELESSANDLQRPIRPKPYFSQHEEGASAGQRTTPSTTAHRIRELVKELHGDHYFAESLGYDCFDDSSPADSSPEAELGRRVGKPSLWTSETSEWDEADLCDFIEVFHDLAARPTSGRFHPFSGCGWHPTKFSRHSGQALYRWRVNRLLDDSQLELRLAEQGEDVGRMVRSMPGELETLQDEALQLTNDADEIAHAVAQFRHRAASRAEKRSAVVDLAGVLEKRRPLINSEFLSGDENALFQIANNFDLRHRRANQKDDYADEYLDWIFYWYLATIQLTDRLSVRGGSASP